MRSEPGATERSLREWIEAEPVFDVHEHHMPELLLRSGIGLRQILAESYAAWTRRRPYPLPSEEPPPATEPLEGPGTWEEDIAPYLEESESNSFVRNVVDALLDIYELRREGLTRDTWSELDRRIRAAHDDPYWPGRILDRARVTGVITDPFLDPLLDARSALGDRYSSVLRINAFALAWHPASRDHNGNSGRDLARRLGLEARSFDDWLDVLSALVDGMKARHQVALKNALAYDRAIDFAPPDESLARRAWNVESPSPRERKAFADLVVDRLCRLAAERGVPVQVHLGSAWIPGSHPLRIAGLLERHPETRFVLMHLAYPWCSELLGMAFVYRNVWVDLTWSHLLSPTRFRAALHEAIEVLPDEGRMMVGGDNWHAEETYGSLRRARHLLASVLAEKVESGWLSEDGARRLARRILHENATAVFGAPRREP